MHYYPFNIGDYRRDSSHLTLLEHGVYRQLLDQYYLDEKPLTLDEDKLFRLISARTEDEKQATRNVLHDFFIKTKDGYVKNRCHREIEFYQERLDIASKAGKASALKRATTVQHEGNDRSTTVQLTNNQEPITNNQEPINNNISIYDHFQEFWDAYPRKVGKQAALKAWNKTKPNIEEVLIALDWQKQSDQWYKNGGQFIPNPATWINQHRWHDERPEQITF